MPDLKKATPGEKISAANYNALIETVQALLTRVRKLEALNDVDAKGIVFDRPIPANVVGVTAPDRDANGAATAGRVTYDIKLWRMDLTLTGLTPVYGRPIIGVGNAAANIRIIPAAVGDRCFVVRRRDENGDPAPTELWITSEAIPAAVCSSTNPGKLSSDPDAQQIVRQQQLAALQAAGLSSGGPATSGGGTSTGGGVGG
jgi:hypothetical protein